MKEANITLKRMYDLEYGTLYLVKDDIEKAYELFVDNVLSGNEGLCITREYPPKVSKRYGLEKTPMVWLTEEKNEYQKTVYSLQDLSILLEQFLNKARHRIVLLDGIEYLITHHKFESFIHLLQLNRSRFEQADSILIAPLLEEALDKKEAKLIEREMKLFKAKSWLIDHAITGAK